MEEQVVVPVAGIAVHTGSCKLAFLRLDDSIDEKASLATVELSDFFIGCPDFGSLWAGCQVWVGDSIRDNNHHELCLAFSATSLPHTDLFVQDFPTFGEVRGLVPGFKSAESFAEVLE